MAMARQLLRDLTDKLMTKVTEAYPKLDDASKAVKLREAFAEKLAELRRTNIKVYSNLLRFCGFFETVGLMVDLGYVELTDIVKLYKGPILDINRCFGQHIQERQNESGVPEGFLEHALKLAKKTEQLTK